MKIFFRLFTLAIGLLILYLLVYFFLLFKAGQKAKDEIDDFRPDISVLQDGNYSGRFGYFGDRFGAEVSFEIKNKQLGLVYFTKLYGTPFYGAPQRVITRIDDTGSLDLDAVSGATITGNLAKAAIKNAIDKGPM